ncbi:MAG: glutamate--tRNA ligase [Planctomycetota bacterium]|nr:glutamate--tRNA ligase [Planctomycetota bacterium]
MSAAPNPGDRAVRVRFAPSPSGYLHIGGARTALFNYLFARRHGGRFVLRVEDTDRERSTPEAVQAIFDGLRYLEIDWDEGPEVGGDHAPYFQSERRERHQACVRRLLESGAAYHCFCSQERLAELRAQQKARKERLHYDRRCAGLTPREVEERLAAGERAIVRFRVPEGRTVVEDAIRGEVVFAHREIEDFPIQRADATPLYNLAVTADDGDMEISHIIRGEDHLSNTPKQVLLSRALGLEPAAYVHIPLILAPGGGKLSKRHGAVSVTEYAEQGYLPEAMINFLVRLGWSYDDKQEIFSREELLEKFSLEGVSSSGAMYDVKKLEHLGGHYVRERATHELCELALPFLVNAGLVTGSDVAVDGPLRERIERMIELEQPRIHRLGELPERLRYYFEDPEEPDKGGRKALRKKKEAREVVKRYAEALERDFPRGWAARDHELLEKHGTRFVEEAGMALGDVAQPVRVLVSGRSATPGLFEVLAVLGRDVCIRRLARADEWFDRAVS